RFGGKTSVDDQIQPAAVSFHQQFTDAFLQGQIESSGTGGLDRLSMFSHRALMPMLIRAFLSLCLGLSAGGSLFAQVTFERLLHAKDEPWNWLMYSGTYSSQRYSRLTQISPRNVRNLEIQWVFQANSLEKFEATPLVVDGVLYTVQPPNDVVAL